jgi:ATP-dependent Clp protease ATP-binding subunit ClpA
MVHGERKRKVTIKRTIQKRILDPLEQKLLSVELRDGDTVVVDGQNVESSSGRSSAGQRSLRRGRRRSRSARAS